MRSAMLTAAAILLCATGTARASTTTVLKVNVPFSFVVNGQTLPAGTYTVQRDDMSSSFVMIRGEWGTHARAIVSTTPDGGHEPGGSQPALTFKRGEHDYRLSGIWQSADDGLDVVAR